MATPTDHLTATLDINRDNETTSRSLKTGTLKPWLTALTWITKPTKHDGHRPNWLADWESFPFEALFGDPPASYQRILERTGPAWAPGTPPPVNDSDEESDAKKKSQPLGLIGQQLYHLLDQRRKREEARDHYKFELGLEALQDLKVIRIRLLEPPETPPPFAYAGDWSHDEEDARSIKLTAVAALWNHEQYRRGATEWLKRKPEQFFLTYPPLAYYQLTMRGTARWDEESGWKLDLVITIRLPHFLGEQSIVTALPSLLMLRCPLAENWNCRHDANLLSKLFAGNSKNSPPFREFFKNHESPKVATLLVASPHLRAAVEKMSELWADPSLRNVLLIAPPGSGKEVLAEFLHAGSVYFGQEQALLKNAPNKTGTSWLEYHEWERSITPLAEVSIAGTKDIAVVRQIVFGRVEEKPPSGEPAVRIGKNLWWTNGLILDARGTTVFLDEIDKSEPEIRSALLRFLENDEIYPINSPSPLRLDQLEKRADEKQRKLKTRLLFAGSKPRKEILDSPPPDFWTRMHRIIEIPHPFEIPDARERKRCIQEYVLLFLYRGVQNKIKPRVRRKEERFMKLDRLLKAVLNDNPEQWKELAEDPEFLKNIKDSYPFLYLGSETARSISSEVASFLARFSASALSVRNLKAIIKQLDYRIELWVEQGIDLLATQDPQEQTPKNREPDAKRHLERAWIWGNLHDITLSLIR